MSKDENLINEVMGVYDVVAEIFDDVFRNEEESKRHGQWLNDVLKDLNVKKVIDAGAGTGEQAIQLWQSGNFDVVVANDLNLAMLNCCRDKLTERGIHFQEGWPAVADLSFLAVTQSDWAELDTKLPEGSFDAIVCLGIAFYHLLTEERFIAALNCWNRLLRPGGYVIIDTPCEHEEIGGQIRSGVFTPAPWNWSASEWCGRSGIRYTHVHGMEFTPLTSSPLGWRTFNTFIVAELTPERRADKLWTFSSGGAILDKKTMKDLSHKSNFMLSDMPKSSPCLYEQVQDFLLQKVK